MYFFSPCVHETMWVFNRGLSGRLSMNTSACFLLKKKWKITKPEHMTTTCWTALLIDFPIPVGFSLDSCPRIWAEAQHLLQDCMCIQRRLGSACSSAQSDQSLRCPPKTLWIHAREDWSDCMDAQADLSLRSTHMQSFRKCCGPAHTITLTNRKCFCVTEIIMIPYFNI